MSNDRVVVTLKEQRRGTVSLLKAVWFLGTMAPWLADPHRGWLTNLVILVNMSAAGLYAYDKLQAVRGKSRIADVSLLCVAVAAPCGAQVGRKLCLHNISPRKLHYSLVVNASVVLWCVIGVSTTDRVAKPIPAVQTSLAKHVAQ